MNDTSLVSVQHLSRHYGNLTAVADVNFVLAQGEVLGFLGPNSSAGGIRNRCKETCPRAVFGIWPTLMTGAGRPGMACCSWCAAFFSASGAPNEDTPPRREKCIVGNECLPAPCRSHPGLSTRTTVPPAPTGVGWLGLRYGQALS